MEKELYKKLYTKDDYTYRSVIEHEGGSVELAEKYLAYQNAGIKAENDLWDKVTTPKVMGELFDLINEKCNLDLHYEFEIKKDYRGSKYLSYESVENLAERDPLLALAWYKMTISNFNGGKTWSREFGLPGATKNYSYYAAKDIDYSKPIEVGFTIDIHYGYEHIDGGTNGAKIGWAHYDGNEWKVELDKDDEYRKEMRQRFAKLDD